MTNTTGRQADHAIESLLLHRWSPRAMSGEALHEDQLFRLFEAARWAPSAFNAQPWRLFYAQRDAGHWDDYLDLLVPANRSWAGRAACLVVIAALTEFPRNGKFSPTHAYDCGAAWQNLALQGSAMGLVVHGMAGFDYERAHDLLAMPDNFAVQAMAAIGLPGPVDVLDEGQQAKEVPSGREPLSAFVVNGRWRAD